MERPAPGSSAALRARMIAGGTVPFAVMAVMTVYVLGPGADLLEMGVALPEISIERVEFVDSEIRATVRNTGRIPVDVVMADINDRIQPAAAEPDGHLQRYETAVVRIPFEWNVAEPYRVGVTLGDGTRFEREVEAAAPAPLPSYELAGFFALIGTYVGIIPVMVGLLWLPFIRRIGQNKYRFFLALTAGLLLFLGVDSVAEAVGISDENLSDSFDGVMLVSTVTVLSFLGLYCAGEWLTRRAGPAASTSVPAVASTAALMISIGIGLHNFGEGLAIGAAVGLGSVALGAFLIAGFAIHNTTEGVAIAAAASRGGVSLPRLAAMGMIAGAPAILGTWVGGFSYSPLASVVFFSVGAGAIFQVIIVLLRWLRREGDPGLSGAYTVSGLAAGMLVMYATSVLL